jgi:hypothetical protein
VGRPGGLLPQPDEHRPEIPHDQGGARQSSSWPMSELGTTAVLIALALSFGVVILLLVV